MKTYGLIGKSLIHSFSSAYFTDKFKRQNIANSEYLPFELEDISFFPQLIEQKSNLLGLNVTIPYKEKIIPYLDELSPDSLAIGAVNTVEFSDGKLIGHNTDCIGFKNSLLPHLTKNHKKALILGTGGASKAIQYTLKKLDISFKIISRTSAKESNRLSYQDINDEIMSTHMIVINTTPLGTYPNIEEKPALPYQYFTEDHLAYDLVYNPEKSAFLLAAEKNGSSIVNGSKMLELQAEASWDIWNNN